MSGSSGDGGTSGTAGTTAGQSGTGGAAGSACALAADCPGVDTACQLRSCAQGVCGLVNVASGTSAGTQSAGDCKKKVCDGKGSVTSVTDDGDAPSSAGLCTLYLCVSGELIDLPKSSGASCGQGGTVCDGSGSCVECVSGSTCASGICKNSACTPLTCADGVKNGTETDKDCGGLCSTCATGKACSAGADCTSGLCSGGVCVSKVGVVGGGDNVTCVARGDGAVKCWGRNDRGQLGLGDTSNRGDEPGEMGDTLPFVDLGTGRRAKALTRSHGGHLCAILDTGAVRCWGRNDRGQLGLGDTSNRGDAPGEMGDALPLVNLGTGRTAVQIAVGEFHSCARLDSGAVKCWGRNDYGQLGLGDTGDRGDAPGEMGDALPAVDLGTGRTAKDVQVGSTFTCALLDNARVKCWGVNFNGQLGLGDASNRGDAPGEMGDALPLVNLGTDRTVTALAVASNHACAVLDNKKVKCWGYGLDGRLGNGDLLSRGDKSGQMGDSLPNLKLGIGHDATALYAGGNHMCAQIDGEYLRCWGWNYQGQLGYGDTNLRGDDPGEMGDSLPILRFSTEHFVQGFVMFNNHGCATLTDDTLKCWGYNGSGQLGQGDKSDRGDEPGEMNDALPTVSF